MRRIYESEAIHTDDADQFTPRDRDPEEAVQATRSINGTAWSRRLVPGWVRHRALSVAVSAQRSEYPAGETVPFRVTMKNTMPFPITIRTTSPLPWTWSVDGLPEASRAGRRDPPDEGGTFQFGRGERKQFTKRWPQMFQVAEAEWDPAGPGEYAIGAGLNVENAQEKGLHDETTVRIVPSADGRKL